MANVTKLGQLAAALPKSVDGRDSTVWIGFFLSMLLVLFLFPTGILSKNEEYYFQVAAQFWSGGLQPFSAIQENSPHLFLSAIAIGLPVQWLGYETANVVLRICTAAALSFSFARMASIWRLSALDAVLIVSIFMLLDQQYFGGEWLIHSVEGKVFAYIFVFLGLAQAFNAKWKSCVLAMIAATWFHFLVGGFWMLVALAWFLLSRQRFSLVLRATLVYFIAVLPLAVMLLWQRIEGSAQDPAIDTWHAYAVMRMAHHIAPFSSIRMIWSWTPGIVFLACTTIASILALNFDIERKARRLLRLLIGLQVYLFAALFASATEIGVRLLGNFYLFRPSSLALLLAVTAMFILYRQKGMPRPPVWISAWLIVPVVSWSAIKSKVEEVAWRRVEPAEISALVDAVAHSTGPSEIVLVQPERDNEHPEVELSRILARPTLVNWDFAPTAPAKIEEWVRRQEFRRSIFAEGCKKENRYPVGALIINNREKALKPVIESCGEVVWSGPNYSVVDLR